MIQPQELRIGNYVFDIDGDVLQIGQILDIGVKFKNTSLSSRYEKIKPIPLTEEILLKFRYKKIRDNEFLFDNHFIIFIKESKIDFCLFNSEGNDFFVCEIQFAHELQNLHYSIRKEELKFKDIS